MSHRDVVIVGAGLAGLCCARQLSKAGVSFQIIEAADGVGGRVRTDRVEGFLLDRGFQVLLTAYPEARDVLDYTALKLHTFVPGALVRFNGKFHRVVDPWRKPLEAMRAVLSPIGSVSDKLRVASLRSQVRSSRLGAILERPESTTLDSLRSAGFSPQIIDRFYRPFFGGIFLEPDLQTSSRMFEFIFRMFSDGDGALPEQGMEGIPRQLSSALPPNAIRLNTRVVQLDGHTVILDGGERISAGAVVVACDGPEAARLLNDVGLPPSRSVSCLYFAADQSPLTEPILVLNGDGEGPINNLCVPSEVTSSYAPDGAALISVTVLGTSRLHYKPLIDSVNAQLQDWFGPDVLQWRHLRTYHIQQALPAQEPPALTPAERPVRLGPGLYVCGDHRDNASINGAMVSGRRAASAVIEDLQ